MSAVIAPGSGNGNLTSVSGRQLTDKQRMKQQQSYNQQVYSDFHEYQKIRDCKSSSLPGISTGNGFKGNGNKMMNNGCNNSGDASSHLIMADSNNGHKFHKNRHQHSASPKQNYKKILVSNKFVFLACLQHALSLMFFNLAINSYLFEYCLNSA